MPFVVRATKIKELFGGEKPIPLSTGREWDKETGLYYYRARYYDPMEGRFISKDPIGFDGGDVNLYGYVQNNPINWVDPSGLSQEKSFLQEYIDRVKKENDSINWSKIEVKNCEISGPVRLNPKIYAELEKQLLKDGAGSIFKALRRAERTLQTHIEKLPRLKYKSQVEGTIQNVKNQIETLRRFIQDHGL